ncbi:HGxxPAAW family protein [Aeromicrobium chenweiae]|uniref:Uncharacterized protein n=1 Tax=Aeromicrobium chenweiae TaxID=2079793 RepID=A0A2S0WL06_9ACTN|nr:HGxxPAAW family protein [Aeromicrobium chenweiae]AWB92023.1 hypothetical protein C3E78_07315 [Aeromicrobium chenweiae]TGN32873.1 hypothetical protein E4L97_09290 [Aeromicrobium chenweiae]
MHGSSPAAWTGVLLCLLGITVGGIGLIPEPNWIVFYIGVGITLASGLIGWGMAAAGFGVDRAEHSHH